MPRNTGNEDSEYPYQINTYKRENKYQKSTDMHGHSRHRKFEGRDLFAQPSMLYTIDNHCKEWGFQSWQGFVRDGSIHNMYYYNDRDPIEEVTWQLCVIEADTIAADMQHALEQVQSFDNMLRIARTSVERERIVEFMQATKRLMPKHYETALTELDQLLRQYGD